MLATENIFIRKLLVAVKDSNRVIFLGVRTSVKPFLMSLLPGAAVVGALDCHTGINIDIFATLDDIEQEWAVI